MAQTVLDPVADEPAARPDPTGSGVSPRATPGRKTRWAGWIMSGLLSSFLTLDAVMKLVKPEPVVKATLDLGYPEHVIVPLGVVLLASTVLYLVPRTAMLGAILLTGYLGGAVATHVRVGNPLVSHTLFPTYLGALLWGGLLLRDAKLRAAFWR